MFDNDKEKEEKKMVDTLEENKSDLIHAEEHRMKEKTIIDVQAKEIFPIESVKMIEQKSKNEMEGENLPMKEERKAELDRVSGTEIDKQEYIDFEEKPKEDDKEKKYTFYEEKVKEDGKRAVRKNKWQRLIVASLIVSIVGGGSIGVGFALVQRLMNGGNQSTVSPTYAKTAVALNGSGLSPVEIIGGVSPSVVSISTTESTSSQFGSFQVPYEAQGAGSGIIFYADDEKVAIATNAHVVEGATSINVTFDEKTTVGAKIVGTDSSADLAVVSVSRKDLAKKGIGTVQTAVFGNSDEMQIGEMVFAIGNALGEGKSATDGIVSAKGKNITVDGKTLQVIQTNAAINPGNSGGALVNAAGEVIGINTAKTFSTVAEGIGYAIPSNVLKSAVEKLLENGSVPKPYIGVKGSDIDEEMAKLYNLPIGALVREVMPGGGASIAGLVPGDIITEFAGKKIMTMQNLVDALEKQKVGSEVQARIIREGQKVVDIKIKILDSNAE